MKEDIKDLKSEFSRIKKVGLIKSLRNGPTGIGYTFETLLNKKEDQNSNPDYKSIELKCRLGYSKSAVTLFNLVPKKHGESAIRYIFEEYSYHRYGNKKDYKLFERKVFSEHSINRYGFEFRLVIDYYANEVIMKSYHNRKFIENVCSWNFKGLERKLKTKLKTLAIVEAYPYRRKTGIYYKYVKINFYKLIGFFEFLKLINEDKIFVSFYIKEKIGKDGVPVIEDHGVGFKIKYNFIEELFRKFKY